MKIIEIKEFLGMAKKLQGKGELTYNLWCNEEGNLYFKILKNDSQSSKPGTFNTFLFTMRIDKKLQYAYDISKKENIKIEDIKNNNTIGFVRAIINNFFSLEK